MESARHKADSHLVGADVNQVQLAAAAAAADASRQFNHKTAPESFTSLRRGCVNKVEVSFSC